MNDDELDASIRDHLHQVAAAAPPPHPSPSPRTVHQSRWRGPLLPAAAALAAVVAAGAIWAGLGGDGGRNVVAGPDDPAADEATTTVARSLVEIEVTWDLDCDTFDHGLGDPPVTIEVETWWSEEHQALRQQWRYPDGTSREAVFAGGPPGTNGGELHEVGRVGGPVTFGCAAGTANIGYPGVVNLFLLNPIPSLPNGDDEGSHQAADVVPGEFEDQLGRPAERRVANGQGVVEAPTGARISATETMEYFIERGTGRMLEQRFSVTYDQIGTASWTAVLVESAEEVVSLDVFRPDGLGERVNLDRDRPTVTTVVGSRERPTTTVVSDPETATTTLMGGECGIETVPDLSSMMPDGFTGPHEGIGGWDPQVPETWCSRFWQGRDEWVHVTQRLGAASYEGLPNVVAGQYRWGEIEDGFALEHGGDPEWSLVSYGLDLGDFSRLIYDTAGAYPDGR